MIKHVMIAANGHNLRHKVTTSLSFNDHKNHFFFKPVNKRLLIRLKQPYLIVYIFFNESLT